jgi:hypothetical protein
MSLAWNHIECKMSVYVVVTALREAVEVLGFMNAFKQLARVFYSMSGYFNSLGASS